MPRLGRTVVPNHALHVVQQGHNKQVVFAEPEDYEYYLATLAKFKVEDDIKVHAFYLMTNHVHLIMQPGEYRWSIYAQRTGEVTSYPWLDTDPCFQGPAETELEHRVRYRNFVFSGIPAGEWELIRKALQRGQLTGQRRFVDELEAIVGRRIECRKPGRPSRGNKNKSVPFLNPIRTVPGSHLQHCASNPLPANLSLCTLRKSSFVGVWAAVVPPSRVLRLRNT